MKRFLLLLVLLASVLVANAWHRRCDEAIVIVATKHLTPEAKKMVKKYLGKSYADDVQYLYDTQRELAKQKKLPKGARNIHDLHLNKNDQTFLQRRSGHRFEIRSYKTISGTPDDGTNLCNKPAFTALRQFHIAMTSAASLQSADFSLHPDTLREKRFHPHLQPMLKFIKVNMRFLHIRSLFNGDKFSVNFIYIQPCSGNKMSKRFFIFADRL